MNAVKGTVRGGVVVLDEPNGLAEGMRVEVVEEATARPALGMREEDYPTTPEGIAVLAQRIRDVEPLEMTAEEEADLAGWRSERKRRELARWEERSRKIEGLFP